MHLKKLLPPRLRYQFRLLTRQPPRYRSLLKVVYRAQPRVILEIGTHRGKNARQMIQTANIFHPVRHIEYIGFDLFEDLTPEDLEREFSLQPPPRDQVRRIIEDTGASVSLHQGNTRQTLPRFVEDQGRPKKVDFVFIDGGHSVDTIASDWSSIRELMSRRTVVVFDDYYLNDENEVPGVGCQSLIDSLDRSEYEVELLEPEDRFDHEWGILRIKMACVRIRAGGEASERMRRPFSASR